MKWVGIFQVESFWVGIIQGGNFPGGSLMGGNFPGGIFLEPTESLEICDHHFLLSLRW